MSDAESGFYRQLLRDDGDVATESGRRAVEPFRGEPLTPAEVVAWPQHGAATPEAE